MTLKARMLVAMAVVAGFLVAASWIVTSITSSYLIDQVDHQLGRFASGPRGSGPRVPPPGGDVGPGSSPAPGTPDAGAFSSVYAGIMVDGELETRLSPGRGTTAVAVPRLGAADARRLARDGGIETVNSNVDGSRYRVAAGVDADGNLVVLGMPLDDVDATVDRLIVTEAISTTSVLLVLGLILWWVLRLGVRPVRRMTESAVTIAGGDLSHRVPEEAPGTEAHELGVALNTMLERIESAFAERAATEERLRRFVADAPHELRTPVTTVRGYAELFRLGGLDDPYRLDAAMARTEAESVRMGRLVEDLLTLARLDRDLPASEQPVALDRIVADAVDDFRVRHPQHPVTARIEPATVSGDPDRLHQVVLNLLTNAAIHTPDGTEVEVEVGVVGGGDRVRLAVRDHGPGLAPDVADRAFERFWRADPSRSRASGGSGLGLSIVAAIVGSMHGTVRLAQPGEGTGLLAEVEFTAARGPSTRSDRCSAETAHRTRRWDGPGPSARRG
ncbi:MAG: HAMP domain-containing sensor histidine kinase [Microthrixaceae bacterium]